MDLKWFLPSLLKVSIMPPFIVYVTTKKHAININGTMMIMKEFYNRLRRHVYASRKEIDRALKQGARSSHIRKCNTVRNILRKLKPKESELLLY